MAFFPDVVPGQDFVPSALLSNNVRRIVNHLNGFGALRLNGAGAGTVRIQVYNASDDSIGAGTAVNFPETGVFCDGAIPAIHLVDPAKPWGVVTRKLAPAEMGDCFISGPVTVAVTGNGDFAQPSAASPDVFTRGSSGVPVLFASNGKGLLNLGAGREYDGPFAVRYDSETKRALISGGYCLINLTGYHLLAMAVSVDGPGYVALQSEFIDNGAGHPMPVFSESRPYPEYRKCSITLARITMNNGNASVKQLHYGDISTVIWGNCEEEEEA